MQLRRTFAGAALVAAVLVPAQTAAAQDIRRARRMGPRDMIPSIDEPKGISVEEARGFLKGDAMVMGVVQNGVARAYPGFILNGHEIANDVLGGSAIAVTW